MSSKKKWTIEEEFLPLCDWCVGGWSSTVMCAAHKAYYTRCNRPHDLAQAVSPGRMRIPVHPECYGLWNTSHGTSRGNLDFAQLEFKEYSK